MHEHPFHNVAIAGVFNTPQARALPGETSASVTLAAMKGALADAGLEFGDVDGLLVGPTRPGQSVQSESSAWGYDLGIGIFWVGGAPIALPGILEAAAAIATGQCHTVLIASGQAGIYGDRTATAPWTRPDNEFVECWGMYTAVEYALVARRHMHLYGTTPEQMAFVASTIRNNGWRNPEALHFGRGPFSAEDVLASRMIADPLRLLDCAVTAEGGSAMVMTTSDRARNRRQPPAYILGGAVEASGWCYTHPPTYEITGGLGREAAKKAFGMAGLSPQDVQVCGLYDGFSFEVIRQFEVFGFCDEGEGGEFVTSGVIGPGEKFPICTDGGALSHSHTGQSQLLQSVVECVRQVRGDAPANQVADAHVALCSSAGAGAMFNPVLLVGDDRP